jgi:hypothetical protein
MNFDNMNLDALVDGLGNTGGGGSNRVRLYEYPNIKFHFEVTGTTIVTPNLDKKADKATTLYYIIEGTITNVERRGVKQGAGVTTDEQFVKAQALIGRSASAMISRSNCYLVSYDANDKQTKDPEKAVRVEVVVANPNIDDQKANGRPYQSLLRFAFAAMRGNLFKNGMPADDVREAVANITDQSVDREKRASTLRDLFRALADSFQSNDETLIGAPIIIETSQYFKKGKDGKPTEELGNGLDFDPIPQVAG